MLKVRFCKDVEMKKDKELILKTTADIKVFLLFILDNIGYPMEHATLMSIVEENTDEISFDYDECLRQLVQSEHVVFDQIENERYYMISDKGRVVASELYDSLDPAFRERSLRIAIKHISLSDRGTSIRSYVSETECKRFMVTLEAFDRFGKIMSTSITVNSRAEAETIRRNFDSKPDGVYRGVLFSLTGRLEYIS